MGKAKTIAALVALVVTLQPFGSAAELVQLIDRAVIQQLGEVSLGQSVEVKLREHGKTIKGKLTSVTRESIEVQTAQSGKVATEKIPLAQIKSINKQRGWPTKSLLVVGGAALLGGLLVGEYCAHNKCF